MGLPYYMRSIDLFSCVGCHALGFERAGISTAMFCEINPWRRARLAEQFPGVPIRDDIRTFNDQGWNVWADIVIGGPPCQNTAKPAAVHGKRTGESLWPKMREVIRYCHPEWVVVEQPPGNEAWEAKVVGDLQTGVGSSTGYSVARFEFGACDVGAPYLRRRVFLVACSSLPRLEVARQSLPSEIDRVKRAADARGDWDPSAIPTFGVDTWRSERVDDRRQRIEALGDSNPPHMAEAIGRAIISACPLAVSQAQSHSLSSADRKEK